MNKTERQAASDAAQASVELEGLIVPKETLTEAAKYIEGEISVQELINHINRQAKNSSVGGN